MKRMSAVSLFLLLATSSPTALSRQDLQQCSEQDGEFSGYALAELTRSFSKSTKLCATGTCVGDGDRTPPGLPDDFVDPCRDQRSDCVGWAGDGECSKNPSYMVPNCAKSCGTCRSYLEPPDEEEDERLAEVMANGRLACEDDEPNCGEWAVGGECMLNPVCESRFFSERRPPYLTGLDDHKTCSIIAGILAGNVSTSGGTEKTACPRTSCKHLQKLREQWSTLTREHLDSTHQRQKEALCQP